MPAPVREESIPRLGTPLSAHPVDFEGADVVVVLPTLNEKDGLSRTLEEIALEPMVASGWTVKRLVVDGGSTDGTLDVARKWAVPVLPQVSRGKGAAIREALEWLAARQVRFAVVLDADCTYPGVMVPAMAQLLDAGSQLVVGVRQPARPARDDPREFVHRLGNRLLNLTASQVAGLPILDLCSGFWAVDVRAAAQLGLVTDGFEIEAELFTKAYRAGYTVTQIPVSYRDRVGVAKLNAMRDGARILLTTIRFGRRRLSAAFRPPTPSQLRDFLSIAMVHDADDFLLMADATRGAEAEEIARRIRASRPGARVQVQMVAGGTLHPIAHALIPSPPHHALTISLPPAGSAAPSAFVHLPSSGRLIEVKHEVDDPAPSAPELSRSGGFAAPTSQYRLEYTRRHSPVLARVRALVTNTFPTERAKELAFLGANGHYGTLSVWSRHPLEDVSVRKAPEPSHASTPASGDPASTSGVLADDSLP